MRAPLTALCLALALASGRARKQCEPITIPLCKGIGYNMTSYPNSYGHEKQDEAGLEVHQFYPLVEVNCYKHLKFFLCSLYTPICQDNFDMSIMPCQEVCIEAQKKCSPIMNTHGFQWPETLNCDRLPKFSEQEKTGKICAAPPDATRPSSAERVPRPSHHKQHVRPHQPQRPCSCQCARPFNPVSAETANYARNGYSVLNVSNCAYSCSGLMPTHSSTVQAAVYQNWIMLIAASSFALSLLTVVSFSLDLTRFPYPERPIMFLALCQMCMAAGYLAQAYRGASNKVGCDADMLRTMSTPDSPVGNSASAECLAVFGLLYYFGMAAQVWWVVLALSWVLAAVPHWSTEWIARYSCYFHSSAWLLPALQTGVVYWVGGVDGDPVSGVCYVGNTNRDNMLYFLIAPTVVYFLLGITFLFVGLQYLWSLRSNLQKARHKTSKLSQLMSKIILFAMIYSASVVTHVLTLLYEYTNRPHWEESLLCPCSHHQPIAAETMYMLSLIKTGSLLSVGWICVIWVFSSKTVQSWRRVVCCAASPYATYTGPKLPFGADLHVSQYQQIPPPPPPLPHPQFPPTARRFHSPDLIYAKQHDLLASPHFSAANTLRHCPRDLPLTNKCLESERKRRSDKRKHKSKSTDSKSNTSDNKLAAPDNDKFDKLLKEVEQEKKKGTKKKSESPGKTDGDKKEKFNLDNTQWENTDWKSQYERLNKGQEAAAHAVSKQTDPAEGAPVQLLASPVPGENLQDEREHGEYLLAFPLISIIIESVEAAIILIALIITFISVDAKFVMIWSAVLSQVAILAFVIVALVIQWRLCHVEQTTDLNGKIRFHVKPFFRRILVASHLKRFWLEMALFFMFVYWSACGDETVGIRSHSICQITVHSKGELIGATVCALVSALLSAVHVFYAFRNILTITSL